MHSKDLYSHSKVVKKHKSQRKSSKEIINRIIPRSSSGSYDLNPFLSESKNYGQNKVNDYKLENDTLSSELMTNSTSNNTDMTTTSMHSQLNKNCNVNKINNNGTISSTSIDPSVVFPKKRTCLGFPLLCFAYFAAIYTLVSKL